MSIKAVIWDVGGVIARTEDLTPRDQLASDLGVTRAYLNDLFFSGAEGTRAQKGEISAGQLMAVIREKLKLKPGEHTNLEARFFAGDRVDYELVDFIRDLKTGYKTGIISNAWGGLTNLLERWGIREVFDVVVGSGDVGIMKPNPQIYQLALEGLQVMPEEAVFVDDFIDNIAGAQAVGLYAIHFKNPGQVKEDIQQLLTR